MQPAPLTIRQRICVMIKNRGYTVAVTTSVVSFLVFHVIRIVFFVACLRGIKIMTLNACYPSRQIGMDLERMRFRQHLSTEMAHYAADCWDMEIHVSYGWKECVGHADRCEIVDEELGDDCFSVVRMVSTEFCKTRRSLLTSLYSEMVTAVM